MRIAEIGKLNGDAKHRRVVLEDGLCREVVFSPAAVLSEYGWDVGSEVEFSEFKRRVSEGEKKLAEDIAYNRLTVAARSEKEIKRALKQKRIPSEAIDSTVEKLKRYSFVNDEDFVREYVGFAKKKYGRLRMEYVLTTEKGVDAVIVKEMLDELLSDEEQRDTAREIARKYATERVLSGKNPRGKIYSYLSARGFPGEICAEVVRSVVGGDEE